MGTPSEIFEAISKRFYAYADLFGPRGDALSSPVNGQQDVRPAVSLLFMPSRPSAVVWAVVAVVVDAVERVVFGWPETHVFDEVFESLPAFADFDSSPAIILELGISWVFASPFHVRPHVMLWRSAKAVRCGSLGGLLGMKTPARLRTAASEFRTTHIALSPAVTATQPSCVAATATVASLDNNPTPKPLTCQVNESTHRILPRKSLAEKNAGSTVREQRFRPLSLAC